MEAGVDLLEVQKIPILNPFACVHTRRPLHAYRAQLQDESKMFAQLTVQFQLYLFPANRLRRTGFKLRGPTLCDLKPLFIKMFRVEFQIPDLD